MTGISDHVSGCMIIPPEMESEMIFRLQDCRELNTCTKIQRA